MTADEFVGLLQNASALNPDATAALAQSNALSQPNMPQSQSDLQPLLLSPERRSMLEAQAGAAPPTPDMAKMFPQETPTHRALSSLGGGLVDALMAKAAILGHAPEIASHVVDQMQKRREEQRLAQSKLEYEIASEQAKISREAARARLAEGDLAAAKTEQFKSELLKKQADAAKEQASDAEKQTREKSKEAASQIREAYKYAVTSGVSKEDLDKIDLEKHMSPEEAQMLRLSAEASRKNKERTANIQATRASHAGSAIERVGGMTVGQVHKLMKDEYNKQLAQMGPKVQKRIEFGLDEAGNRTGERFITYQPTRDQDLAAKQGMRKVMPTAVQDYIDKNPQILDSALAAGPQAGGAPAPAAAPAAQAGPDRAQLIRGYQRIVGENPSNRAEIKKDFMAQWGFDPEAQ